MATTKEATKQGSQVNKNGRPRGPNYQEPKVPPPSDLALFIEPTAKGASTYSAVFRGEPIVQSSETPALDACRVLTDRGITGTLKVYNAEAYPNFCVDIAKGSGLTVKGSRFTKYTNGKA